jgi:1-phosphatidylinositol phosphodiesterase
MFSWLKKINDLVPISCINLPGTHDSCAYIVQFPFLSQCQNTTIAEQLHSGIRFLDIRVEKSGEKLKLIHDIADCKSPENKTEKLYLDDVINDCKKFLSKNPSETILLSYKRDDGANQEETFDTFFENYLEKDTIWYKENRIPILKEVRGKIVLLNRDNIDKSNEKYTDFNTGINLSTWVYQKENIEKIYETAELLGRDGNLTGKNFTVQDLYGLTPQKKWSSAVASFLKNPPEADDILITFFSCGSIFYNPKRSAKYINKRLEKTTLERAKKYGWIIMDYPTEKFIKKNNKL